VSCMRTDNQCDPLRAEAEVRRAYSEFRF